MALEWNSEWLAEKAALRAYGGQHMGPLISDPLTLFQLRKSGKTGNIAKDLFLVRRYFSF